MLHVRLPVSPHVLRALVLSPHLVRASSNGLVAAVTQSRQNNRKHNGGD